MTGKEQTDSADRPVVGQTKGGSERKRLADQWRREAADARVTADILKRHPITKSVADDLIDLAVVCERHADELEAALLSETQPQSGTGTVEECPACGHNIIVLYGDGTKECDSCAETWGHGGDGESGACLPNANCPSVGETKQ